jgi:hypothetical protein
MPGRKAALQTDYTRNTGSDVSQPISTARTAVTAISVSAAAIMIALLSYRAFHIERGGSADLSAGLGRLGETAPRCRPYVGRRDRGVGFATSGQTFGICCHSGRRAATTPPLNQTHRRARHAQGRPFQSRLKGLGSIRRELKTPDRPACARPRFAGMSWVDPTVRPYYHRIDPPARGSLGQELAAAEAQVRGNTDSGRKLRAARCWSIPTAGE